MFNYFELNNPRDFQYLLNSAGEDILINGISTRALITNTNLNESSDNKKITTLENIERGFLIDYDNAKWLVVSEVNGMRYGKYKGIMQKCNNFITINSSGLHRVDCIVTNKASLNVDFSTYITTIANEVYVWISNTEFNNQININNIYLLGNLNYSVVSIDDISNKGILILKLEFTAESQVFPDYSITILNGDVLTTDTDTPVQLNVEQKDGETVLTESLPVIFTSSDELVATVSATGYVTPVSVGSVTINVALESDETVNDSIVITVEEVPVVETYTLELTGEVEIYSGDSENYTCVKKNISGVVVEGSQFDFTIIPGTTPTSAYTLTILNDTQCSIKANAKTYYIDLVATDRADNTLTVSKHLKLTSFF